MKIEITIDTKLKTYLRNKGLDETEVAQHLLDTYLDRMVDIDYKSKSTKQEKIDKITNK